MPLNAHPNLWKNKQSLSQILWSCDLSFYECVCGSTCVHIFSDVSEDLYTACVWSDV